MKKYYRMIRGLEIMADIQYQLQNIIQLAEIETTILQAINTHKIQTEADIFSILEEL